MENKFWKGFFSGCLVSTVVFVLLAFLAVKTVIGIFTYPPTEYTDPKDYPIIKEKIEKQDEIRHFPAQIPQNATEAAMYGYTDMPYSGEMLILEFKIDRPYIEKELKKYDFWNKNDKIGTKRKIYHMPKPREDFNADDYTYYVIDKADYSYIDYFPYYNGIGVDGNKNKILYYHIYPED